MVAAARPASRCFSLFFHELSASEVSSSAEILGCDSSRKRNNSKTPAAPPLFFAVLVRKNSDNK
jgi:hypothetical protein